MPDDIAVRCTDCGWQGTSAQLSAQACPVCDGRIGEEGSVEYELAARCEICGESAGEGGAICPACASNI